MFLIDKLIKLQVAEERKPHLIYTWKKRFGVRLQAALGSL